MSEKIVERTPQEVHDNIVELLKEIQQLKDAINEIREYVNNHIHQKTFTGYMDSYELKKLLRILDKVGD